ncbi:MAG: bacterioferritin-associated ferredoxin [Candidatus Azotimanducaceae bacterium]|jgi:bacterioferritin-associated ferredoxin
MMICVCKRINSAQIKEALDDGVTQVAELSDRLGLGTGCGRCVEFTKKMLMSRQSDLIASDGVA